MGGNQQGSSSKKERETKLGEELKQIEPREDPNSKKKKNSQNQGYTKSKNIGSRDWA